MARWKRRVGVYCVSMCDREKERETSIVMKWHVGVYCVYVCVGGGEGGRESARARVPHSRRRQSGSARRWVKN